MYLQAVRGTSFSGPVSRGIDFNSELWTVAVFTPLELFDVYTCTCTLTCRYEKLEAEALAGEERFEEIMKKWDAPKGSAIPQVCHTCTCIQMHIHIYACIQTHIIICRIYSS